MKLDLQVDKQELQRSENFDSVNYEMDFSQAGLLFRILSQYSNPIGSLIREITTNAVDSHIEAGVTDTPVIVRLSGTNMLTSAEHTFEVQDFGTGLSPHRVANIYTKFLASTKRENNDQHGAYGLGSKSPLSYSDVFFVTTYYEGTRYDFWIHKAKGVPVLEKVGEEPTDKPNGTRVQVPIVPSDLHKFKTEIGRQLRYFENVYYENCGIENEFTIYRGDNFLFNPKDKNDDLHICLGKVYYPLDLKAMGYKGTGYYSSDPKWTRMPVALKFDIGELPIVWNRENIEYTEQAIETIKAKAELALEELQQMYNEKFDGIKDIATYIDALNTSSDGTMEITEGVRIPVTRYLDTNPRYPKYDSIGIPKDTRKLFSRFKFHKRIEQGLVNTRTIYKSIFSSLEKDHLYFAEENYSTTKNKYIYEEILPPGVVEFYIIRKAYVSDLDYFSGSTAWAREDSDEYDPVKVVLRDEFLSEVDKFALKHMKSYDDITVPQSFKDLLKSRKASPVRKDALKPYREREYMIRVVAEANTYRGELEFREHRRKGKQLIDYNGLMIYGHRDQADELLLMTYILKHYPQLNQSSYHFATEERRAIVFKISQSYTKLIEDKPNAIFVEDILEKYNNRIFMRIAGYKYILKHYSEIPSTLDKYQLLFPEYSKQINTIRKYFALHLPYGLNYHLKSKLDTLLEKVPVNKDLIKSLEDIALLKSRYAIVEQLSNTQTRSVKEDLDLYIQAKGRYNITLLKRLTTKQNQQTHE